ncbi:hypothetical protein [Candidatus Raskinella chloraquaticus]|uniref:Uncharacterized protein n=1 Tax=Candidatus Raskinella chloraquaticus TaxID=1951219 RepID=A0A1W9I5E2_9HYPH|nr:MAG: hypothetical protein A4S15_03535 [Proteobacteria bacterium SG_bin8]
MPLQIETFSNATGGNSFYKAITHPLAAPKGRSLLEHLRKAGPVAIYDPQNLASSFGQFYGLQNIAIAGYFVQDVEQIGRTLFNHVAQPVTAMRDCAAKAVLVAAFDGQKLVDPVAHLLPLNAPWYSFDGLRLPDAMLSDKARYLSPLNFATNLAFFRDAGGQHTRLVTANYWTGYSGKDAQMWFCLFDGEGKVLAEWQDPLPPAQGGVVVDSKLVRARFRLPEFTGQLFVHVVGAAGHDVCKYALDTYGDDASVLSCTHDANAWPSDVYAGLPAPEADEEVVLWVQNSHPFPIASGEIGLNLMGHAPTVTLQKPIAPYATYRLSVAELLPQARWPQQIEIKAGKHFVRPRYEIFNAKTKRSRISHPNVERTDLKPDPRLYDLHRWLGKLHILPAPFLPPERFRSVMQPTPMSTTTETLPVKALLFDASGEALGEHRFGSLKRSDSIAFDLTAWAKESGMRFASGYGHVELVYDFDAGGEVDGWLHSLFRYYDAGSGHVAETSFGSHIFNTALVYKNEPQSYAGKPPGLTTRLFLRLGGEGYDSFCHLVYPASTPWHERSETSLVLTSKVGQEVARRVVSIPCSGSLFFRASEMFTDRERAEAGEGGYVLIRDTTCRLFGYHGLMKGDTSFSLDHMFGF